jgi:GR25 family glycosyltransferase involved in LPS biosynthesis
MADPSRPGYMPRIAVRCDDGREHAWEEHAGAQGYLLTWQAAEAMTRVLCNETGVTGTVVSKLIAAVDRLASGGTIHAVVDACRAAIAEAEASVEPANA